MISIFRTNLLILAVALMSAVYLAWSFGSQFGLVPALSVISFYVLPAWLSIKTNDLYASVGFNACLLVSLELTKLSINSNNFQLMLCGVYVVFITTALAVYYHFTQRAFLYSPAINQQTIQPPVRNNQYENTRSRLLPRCVSGYANERCYHCLFRWKSLLPFDRAEPVNRLDPDALILDTEPLPLEDVTYTSIPVLTGDSLSIPNSCIADFQKNTENLGMFSRFTRWWVDKVYSPLSSRYCRNDSMESDNNG